MCGRSDYSRKIENKYTHQTFQLTNMKILLVLELNRTGQFKSIHLGIFLKILKFLYGIVQIRETL